MLNERRNVVVESSAARQGSPWPYALLLAGIWIFLGLVAATQIGLVRIYSGQRLDWRSIIDSWLAVSTIGLFTPLLLWFVRRWPLARETWARTGAAYLAFITALIVVRILLFIPIRQALFSSVRVSLGQRFLRGSFPEFFGFTLALGIVFGLEYHRTSRESELRASQLEARLSQAQLEVLRNQMRPHFLFNTLHSISTLMHRDVEAADEMMVQLGDLLRLSLESEGVEEVPLRNELEILEHYLKIMRLRYGERLTSKVQVAPGLLDAQVPQFLLQPLVENAIEHGIARTARPGCVVIRGDQVDGMLLLTVSDDGAGAALAAIDEGIGLSNTRRRLRELYGVRARLELMSGEASGTKVVVTLPLLESRKVAAQKQKPT